MMDYSDKYADKFRASTPDTRNMDTLCRQAKRIRALSSDSSNKDKYEFIADNMERIAEEYSESYTKMCEARALIFDLKKALEKITNFK
jgi:hypothetical protein